MRGEAVLTRTRNLCFGAKISKIGKPQFFYLKVRYMGVNITRKCYPDADLLAMCLFRFTLKENLVLLKSIFKQRNLCRLLQISSCNQLSRDVI